MGIMNKTIRVAKIKVKKPSTYRLANTGQEKSHSIGNQAALDGLNPAPSQVPNRFCS